MLDSTILYQGQSRYSPDGGANDISDASTTLKGSNIPPDLAIADMVDSLAMAGPLMGAMRLAFRAEYCHGSYPVADPDVEIEGPWEGFREDATSPTAREGLGGRSPHFFC